MTIKNGQITLYELLALIVSIIAILIPIIQGIIRWAKKPRLSYYSGDRITLFFNHSGPYFRIDGVFEAKKAAISLKSIDATVIRLKDRKKLDYSWSYFISPVNQNVVGNYVQTTEKAHPFRIEADHIYCAFTEFADPHNSFNNFFTLSTSKIKENAELRPLFSKKYDEAAPYFFSNPDLLEIKKTIENDFYWLPGEYELTIKANSSRKESKFSFVFRIDDVAYNNLLLNVNESFAVFLKKAYGIQSVFNTETIPLIEKKEGGH